MANILVIGINYSPEPTGSAPYTSGLAEMLVEYGNNVEALVHLAECYELTNQKPLALECYQKVKQSNKIKSKEFNDAIDKRIQQLKK